MAASLNLAGSDIGRYRLVSLIGAGGMGEVYDAIDSSLGRHVALKILKADAVSDPKRLARFVQEARSASALNHPHLVSIYEIGEHANVHFIAMEKIDGSTLRSIFSSQRLPLKRALELMVQITEALAAAHGAGVVHRDLKPENIMVSRTGYAKVLDFGLAKLQPETALPADPSASTFFKATDSGTVLGTVGYMSPEQAQGKPADPRSDIFSLGCILYEAVAGRRAFHGANSIDTLHAIIHDEPAPLCEIAADAPIELQRIVRKALVKDPEERYQSAKEMAIDLRNAGKEMESAAQHRWNRRRVAASMAATAVLAILVIGAVVWSRGGATRALDRSQWVQLTKLDSVSQPALSADGRMLAFVRGPETFLTRGQVYVKVLPDGEPAQLTHDDNRKMSPVFSPDGARVAYTSVARGFRWDTWVVPVLGGEPQLWLRNASGLSWTGRRQVLFSEIRKSPHMGIVAAEESRIGQHDVYLPAHEHGMAHRSYASPDGKSVLLVEMDQDHAWLPCRLVPANGGSTGRQVGPPGAACTSGAWSPDGKWMYLSSNAGGTYHIWRQRFPDGPPEQITSGPTEEEGIVLAADGRSFVTAVALKNASLWLHNASGERQISLEGNAVEPKFTPDGTKLCYRVIKEAPSGLYDFARRPGEVRVADLATGRSEPLVPDFQVFDYDISADGRDVVMEAADRDGRSRLWLVAFDRRSPPRQIPNVQGRQPRFGPDGDIIFCRAEGASGFVYRVHRNGTGIRKAIEPPIALLFAVSRDGRWIVGWAPLPGGETMAIQAFPLRGGPPVLIGWAIGWNWSPSGNSLEIAGDLVAEGRSYIIPLPAGEALPRIPAGGFRSEQQIAQLPGARRIDALTVPGPSPDVYAIDRSVTQRNLYRIPLQ